MNFLKTLLVAFSVLFTAAFAQADSLENMSNAERDAFRAEVRAYLLDNPEVILEAIDVLERRKAQEAARGDLDLIAENYEQLTNDGYSWVGGNPEGTINMVEFSDYRCTYCKRAHPEIKALLAANDDVRFVLIEYPILGPDSILAAKAALSIMVYQGDEIYEVFSDKLMSYNGAVNNKSLAKIAKDSGANVELMEQHMDDEVITQMIANNHALGQRMNVSGTPSFMIGPEMLRGFAPAAAMQKYVDRARATLRQ